MVALATGDHVAALGLADFHEVLARQLQRRFHRLGAAGDEVHRLQSLRRTLDQEVRQRFHRLAGEEGGVGIGERADLLADRLDHAGVAVAEAGHRRAAAGVQVALALAVDQIGAVAADGGGVALGKAAVEYVAHDALRCILAKNICKNYLCNYFLQSRRKAKTSDSPRLLCVNMPVWWPCGGILQQNSASLVMQIDIAFIKNACLSCSKAGSPCSGALTGLAVDNNKPAGRLPRAPAEP
ncbi:hypothetical protein FQZ97_930390 [compost metagenome]